MASDSLRLSDQLHGLEQKVIEVLARYPDEQRKTDLQDLLLLLARASEAHYRLISTDEGERLRIRECDYHEILEHYLPVLRKFADLPKSNPGSVYELGVVCAFDEVLVHHCDGHQ